jgi:hypothetical protein
MRLALALAVATLAAAAALPGGARAQQVISVVPQDMGKPVQWGPDSHGYGRVLAQGVMRARLAEWDKRGIKTAFEVAQLSLRGDGQPEFAVRVENRDMCDANGCVTFVFMLLGRDWKEVFQSKARTLSVGSGATGMQPLYTNGSVMWGWNGTRYDVAQ